MHQARPSGKSTGDPYRFQALGFVVVAPAVDNTSDHRASLWTALRVHVLTTAPRPGAFGLTRYACRIPVDQLIEIGDQERS